MDTGKTRSVERAARNELTFREATSASRRRGGRPASPAPSRTSASAELERCTELPLAVAEYSEARAGARWFLLAPGHPAREARIVEDRGTHVVVEKSGESGEIAERLA